MIEFEVWQDFSVHGRNRGMLVVQAEEVKASPVRSEPPRCLRAQNLREAILQHLAGGPKTARELQALTGADLTIIATALSRLRFLNVVDYTPRVVRAKDGRAQGQYWLDRSIGDPPS